MKKYKELTSGRRYQTYGLKQAGLNQTQITQKIGANRSTISKEFRQNKGQHGWRPKQAHWLQDERKQTGINGKQFSSDSQAEIERSIRKDLSPEQVTNRLELEGELQISHEAIYRHVYADNRDEGNPYRHLRNQKSRRQRYASGHEQRSMNKNRVSIITAELQATIYFAHPHRSWRQGLNKNSNGLFRQYFPKGMELTDITGEQLQRAVKRLNHRPTKCWV